MPANRLAHLSMLFVLAVPLAALGAPKKAAQQHVAKAMEAHKRDRFADAIVELQAAYAIDPQPDLLFAIGQLHVKLNNCPEAIAYYERYLATSPTPNATADTRQAIDTCKAGTPPTEQSSSVWRWTDWSVAPPLSPPAATPWYRDPLGDVLVVGGTAALVVGAFVYHDARSEIGDANAAPSYARHLELVDDARTKRTYAVVLIGGGAALAAAGVLHYVLRDRGREAPRVGMVPVDGGGLITWMGPL